MPLDLVKPAQTAPLPIPSQEERNAFIALDRNDDASHARTVAGLGCMQRVEAPLYGKSEPLSFPLTVAAWNVEQCYAVEKTAELLRQQEPGIVLLSEVDNGMARTAQRHTSRDIAGELDMAYAFGVEHLELVLGGPVHLEYCKDDFNLRGFHGNAVLAPTELVTPVMIRLETHGHWFRAASKAHRIGTRCAIAAAIPTTEGPIYAVSVHLENDADAAYREAETRRMLDAIDGLVNDMPVIIGGDLNTGLADGGDYEKETLFAHAYGRGYERHGGPLDQMTTRPSRISRNPRGTWKLDWFLTRGLEVTESKIVPALAPDGEVLSDHDMIVATIAGVKRS